MDTHKVEFIEYLLNTGALRLAGDSKLKSGRISPWFVNIGDFNDGESTFALGKFYAAALDRSGTEFDIVYGIPEKGVGLAIAASIGLAQGGTNVPWFFTRKQPKDRGEATNLSQAERIKARVVGRAPQTGMRIAQLDDVFTAGDAKYEARTELESLGDFQYPVLAIAVDRQEVGIDGKSAIAEYEAKTGTKVVSVVNASDVYQYLTSVATARQSTGYIPKEIDLGKALSRMENYLRVYGTDAVRSRMPRLEQRIIELDRSVVPACDVETLEQFEELVKQTADVEKVGGYKVGFQLGLGYGLPKVVETARKHTDKPIIYDHQKAGTDIPDTGKNFASVCKKAGVDAVSLFPQAGPETQRAWMYHALDQGLQVIVGGRMTHPAYAVSEGGYITNEGAMDMYRNAARAGISNFVVPGNKPAVIREIKELIESEGVNPILWAPGFVAQGGLVSESGKVAGERFHAIVGRGITEAPDMYRAAIEHTSQL